MGQSSGSKQANRMMDQTFNDARGFGQDFSKTFMDRGTAGYNRFSGVQDEVLGNYRNMLSGVGTGGGGGIPGQNEYLNKLGVIEKLGAFSPEQANTLRGYGVPKEFAETGGFTGADKANFRARATASVPGLFDAMRRNLSQRAAVTGGTGPGFDAATMALARGQARSGAEAALGAETNLADMIRSGRQWGAETGAGLEKTLFSNMRSAMEGQCLCP